MKDTGVIEIYGHIKIQDPNSGKIFLDKRIDKPKKEIEHNERFNKTTGNRPLKDNK